MKDGLKGSVAEFLATTTFFFLACVVTVKAGLPAGLVWGGSLGIAVLVFGGFNAAHVNPAVTLGMVLGRRLPWYVGLMYWVAQIFGSLTGLMFGAYVITERLSAGFAWQFIVRPADDVNRWHVLGLEALATFFLTLAVAFGTDKLAQKWAAWLIIGGALGLFVWLIGPISGGAINPVRAFAPWMLVRPESGLILATMAYIVAPLAGAVVAGLLYRAAKGSSDG